MSRNLQPVLVRGVFAVALSLLAIGGATAQAIAFALQDEAGVAQCTAVTPPYATLALTVARSAG